MMYMGGQFPHLDGLAVGQKHAGTVVEQAMGIRVVKQEVLCCIRVNEAVSSKMQSI